LNDAISRALNHVCDGPSQRNKDLSCPITLNFHPDLIVAGSTVIERISQSDSYQSQFETGTSSGGLSASAGGERWNWESRIFGGAYDDVHASVRPKYGALNYKNYWFGGAPRFGSCHLRCAAHVGKRTSFCYPDSHLEPYDFAVGNADNLIDLAERNERALDQYLDNYVEAHVHGTLKISTDIEAIVLDPSFQGTTIEKAARDLACQIEWHNGFLLDVDRIDDCTLFRGPTVASAIMQLAENGPITPATIWQARESKLDYQMAKWIWHCMVRFGSTPLNLNSHHVIVV
jgi:hypothetical protein